MSRVEEVIETLTVRKDGALLSKVCLDFTVYTLGGLRAPKVRAGIIDFYQQAREQFGAQWTWVETDEPVAPRRVNAAILDWLPKWLAPDTRAREQYTLLLRDGDKTDDIGTTAFEIGGVGHGDFPAFVRLSLPVSWIQQHGPVAYAHLCEGLVRSLPYISGRAGYSLRWDEYQRRHGKLGLQNADLLSEWYFGIDLPDDSAWILEPEAATTLPTISWLTFLGGPLLEQAGGKDGVAEHLSDRIAVRPAGNGVVLQAGLRPETGNSPNPSDLDPYREVALTLRPLLTPRRLAIVRNTEAWLRRFEQITL